MSADQGTAPAVILQPARMVELGRIVVGLVVTVVILLLAVAGAVAAFAAGQDDPQVPFDVVIGPFDIWMEAYRPPTGLLLAVVFALISITAGAAVFELLAALRILRNPERTQLERAYPKDAIVPQHSAELRVTVLIPAHNEELALPAALGSLGAQHRQPDRIIVVADNCTDGTVGIARAAGCEVYETVDNHLKKGGALNQVLTRILPAMGENDVVMVMDADTELHPQYLTTAHALLLEDPALQAVGGVFFGEEGHGLLGQFQRNEYLRYSLEIRRRRGRVFVLTGTASVFRAPVLRLVADARSVFIPGEHGQVYDTAALTEDNELTVALKSLGAPMLSPSACKVTTELMPTWRNLWKQRLRWQRGALENLGSYGITTATIRYWGQQIGIAYAVIALTSAYLLLLVTILSVNTWIWFPFWIGIGLIFVVERVATVWHGGWRARILAALLLPELIYDSFLQTVFVRGMIDIALGRQAQWGHVEHAGEAS